MTITEEIHPDTAFSLAAAAGFGFGPVTGRPTPGGDGAHEMRMAFVTDDMRHHAGVHLAQPDGGTITATIDSMADPGTVTRQVRRILSLDHPAAEWPAAGERDPVLGQLQREHAGLRPVLFHSPYEAAAWSIVSARRYRAQATAIRTRICQAIGTELTVAGAEIPAFPLPKQLLAADSLPGMGAGRVEWLHEVARAALDGRLDPGRLVALEPADALADLRRLPGIGPAYATLILLRAVGVTDVLTLGEPRLPEYVAHFYGTGPGPASAAEIERIADRWRPFRTWAAVLIRAAGDRRELPLAA
jgi:DNA-3-methyladenine glycosylase II